MLSGTNQIDIWDILLIVGMIVVGGFVAVHYLYSKIYDWLVSHNFIKSKADVGEFEATTQNQESFDEEQPQIPDIISAMFNKQSESVQMQLEMLLANIEDSKLITLFKLIAHPNFDIKYIPEQVVVEGEVREIYNPVVVKQGVPVLKLQPEEAQVWNGLEYGKIPDRRLLTIS